MWGIWGEWKMFKDKLSKFFEKGEEEQGGNNKKKIENFVFFIVVLIITIVAINLIWNDKKSGYKTNEVDPDKVLADDQVSSNEEVG